MAVTQSSPDHSEGDELCTNGKRKSCSREDSSGTQQAAFNDAPTGRSENTHGKTEIVFKHQK